MWLPEIEGVEEKLDRIIELLEEIVEDKD